MLCHSGRMLWIVSIVDFWFRGFYFFFCWTGLDLYSVVFCYILLDFCANKMNVVSPFLGDSEGAHAATSIIPDR